MELEKTLEAVREIDRITKENPAVLLLIREMKESGSNVVPIISDSLVPLSKAAKILGTTPNYICDLVKKNMLPCWILPGQTKSKFKISDLHNFMMTKLQKGGKDNEHKAKSTVKKAG